MASERFNFHYVPTPTGSLSGQSLIHQTEDAINALGDYMYNATFDASESLRLAQNAYNLAESAQNTASSAFTYAGSALGKVNTVEATVNAYDYRVSVCEKNSSSALTASGTALSASNSALATSNEALTAANSAVATAKNASENADDAKTQSANAENIANDAKATATKAAEDAKQAVVDGDRIKGEIQVLVSEAEDHAGHAATSETNAKASEDASSDNAELAKKWATFTPDPVEPASGEEGSEDLYSARQYSLNAAASEAAAKASAISASESETNAKDSERSASDSATASASSAISSANSERGASTYANEAANWAKKMDAPVEAETTDEETGEVTEALYSSRWYAAEAKTARDEAVAAAGQNQFALTFKPQTLTEEEKAQARLNIGAIGEETIAQATLDAFEQFNTENGI